VLITYALTHIVVRTAPFYPDSGDLLAQVRNEWNTNQTAVARDVVHMMRDSTAIGGVGQLAAVCDLDSRLLRRVRAHV
jgi:hypothetical protein